MPSRKPKLRHTYVPIEFVERLEHYKPGGFHPILIGDEFKGGRYRIVHKLGYGSFCTVWLARDCHAHRLVSIKVLSAGSSQEQTHRDVIKALKDGDPSHPGRQFVSFVEDEFFHTGPNGTHHCIVTLPAGCSISSSKSQKGGKFPLKAAYSLSAQLLFGLAYIHSCGVVHGDLHLNNILLQIPSLGTASLESLLDRFGPPIEEPVERVDGNDLGPGVPRYAVEPLMVDLAAEDVPLSIRLTIIDFSESFLVSNKSKPLRGPILLRPPESFFESSTGQAGDVWTAGALVFQFMGTRSLFRQFLPTKDGTIVEWISALGPLPELYSLRWESRAEYLTENGHWIQGKDPHEDEPHTLRDRLYGMGRGSRPETCEFPPADMELFEQFLRSLLRFLPNERPSLPQVLEHTWMTEVALPITEKCIDIVDVNGSRTSSRNWFPTLRGLLGVTYGIIDRWVFGIAK